MLPDLIAWARYAEQLISIAPPLDEREQSVIDKLTQRGHVKTRKLKRIFINNAKRGK